MNPKDTKEEIVSCEFMQSSCNACTYLYRTHFHHTCGKYIYTTSNGSDNHFPGCHKVHLECANKKIDKITDILNVCIANDSWGDSSIEKWLESAEVKE